MKVHVIKLCGLIAEVGVVLLLSRGKEDKGALLGHHGLLEEKGLALLGDVKEKPILASLGTVDLSLRLGKYVATADHMDAGKGFLALGVAVEDHMSSQ